MINNESQTHCQKVIGIIHTGFIGIADSLLTILRATGEASATQTLWLVMGTGLPRANFCQPAPIPTESHTRLYGCGIPVLTGVGLKGPTGTHTEGDDEDDPRCCS